MLAAVFTNQCAKDLLDSPHHPRTDKLVTMSHRFHATPMDAVADRVRERVVVEGMTFTLERPAGLDRVFDHPAVRNAYAADEYIPYWTDLWAAGRMLAKAILREDWNAYPLEQRDVLEIGCGLGLGGIAALACRLHVTFSDVDETAVMFAAINAKLNGHERFTSRPIDLRSPPAGVTFPIIIGSDLMYEQRMVEPVATFIKRVLTPDGTALITDPDRLSSRSFRWQCGEVGLDVEPSFIRAGEPGGERTKGTLYRIRQMQE
jgi:ETFB lysine methyltransferase